MSSESFSHYYIRFIRAFGHELWSTWRTEAWPSVLIALAIYGLTRHEDLNAWRTFLYTAEASGLYLSGWGLYHLIRAPWKLSLKAAGPYLDENQQQQRRSLRVEWRELGTDFESTRTVGSAHWRTQGGVVTWWINDEKLIVLCALAGSKLTKSPQLAQTVSQSVLSEPDPMKRWLLYVREQMPRAWATAQMDWNTAYLSIPDKGEIRSIANTSALVCITCSAEEQ